MSSSPPEDAIACFTSMIRAREKAEHEKKTHAERIVQVKSKHLIPMRRMLRELQEMGTWVSNASCYGPGAHVDAPPQLLEPYENTSSPSWTPGISIFLDHPARLEIAVPNEADSGKWGALVIAISSVHPDAALLKGPFATVNEGCVALARFLATATLRVEHLPS